jgi:transcriptional regulator with XRE-family HTH domain
MPPPRTSRPRSSYHAALGRAIELVIAENGLTQDSVAMESGLNVRQVGALVRGRGNPTYTTILKLCRGLHVRPGWLMALAEELQTKFLDD